MKTTIPFRILRWWFVTILGVLGFSACGDDDPADTPVAYGTPTATYIYRGTVTDEEGNPIEGIDVVFHGIVEGTMNASLVEDLRRWYFPHWIPQYVADKSENY